MKKSYKIEVPATAGNIAALDAASIDYTLYEVNEVRNGSDVFAHHSNFKFTELLLNPVETIDNTEYTKDELANHAGKLLKNMPYKMTKEVRL